MIFPFPEIPSGPVRKRVSPMDRKTFPEKSIIFLQGS
jgi:hypothetical protein